MVSVLTSMQTLDRGVYGGSFCKCSGYAFPRLGWAVGEGLPFPLPLTHPLGIHTVVTTWNRWFYVPGCLPMVPLHVAWVGGFVYQWGYGYCFYFLVWSMAEYICFVDGYLPLLVMFIFGWCLPVLGSLGVLGVSVACLGHP